MNKLQMKGNWNVAKGKLKFLLNVAFSTTTDLERIVGAVVVMDAFQPYFDYVMRAICGIPVITLDGSNADWELLVEKVELLHNSDLDLAWWTTHLLPLCDQFVRASRGDVDTQHWNNLCKITQRYGVEDLNGWLVKFIPYVRRGHNQLPVHRNPVLDLDERAPVSQDDVGRITGCTSNMLPSGISRVPVVCQNRLSSQGHALEFLAGFTGVRQSAEDLGLRPIVGWAIGEAARIDILIERVRKAHGCTAPAKTGPGELMDKFDSIEGDMWKFYTEIDGVRLNYAQPNPYGETTCDILPFRSVKRLWDVNKVLGELRSLQQQGLLSTSAFTARKEVLSRYAEFHVIARSRTDRGSFCYLTGRLRKSAARIFRWDGSPSAEGFIPVANSFTEWLETVLHATGGSYPADPLLAQFDSDRSASR